MRINSNAEIGVETDYVPQFLMSGMSGTGDRWINVRTPRDFTTAEDAQAYAEQSVEDGTPIRVLKRTVIVEAVDPTTEPEHQS